MRKQLGGWAARVYAGVHAARTRAGDPRVRLPPNVQCRKRAINERVRTHHVHVHVKLRREQAKIHGHRVGLLKVDGAARAMGCPCRRSCCPQGFQEHCCSAKHPEQDVCIQSVHERIEACKRVSAWSEHLLIGKRGSGEDWLSLFPAVVLRGGCRYACSC